MNRCITQGAARQRALWRITGIALTVSTGLFSAATYAVGFGVFDARTQALAGTSVALGDLATGHLYNPALTALHRGDEDETDDGRHSIPMAMSLSNAAEVAVRAINDNLEGRLSIAIDNFNANPGAETALIGEQAAVDLKTAMVDMEDGSINGDMYLGYSISEPGDREGGAFFIGSRVVGSGVATIENDDIDLIDNYIEALQFIHSGGSQGTPHPELFLADGQLADPNDAILSSAMARVAVITEMGLSAAKMVQLWGQAFSFGIAPKATNIRLFDDQWEVVEGNFQSSGEDKNDWYFNMDMGLVWAPTDALLVGLSTKDILTNHYTSSLGYRFALKPRTRLGIAYNYKQFRLGMDMDVVANHTFTDNKKQQDISFGVEYTVLPGLQLRAGYYHDIEETFEGKAAFGFGYQWKRLTVDLAYASNSRNSSFGLQFGLTH